MKGRGSRTSSCARRSTSCSPASSTKAARASIPPNSNSCSIPTPQKKPPPPRPQTPDRRLKNLPRHALRPPSAPRKPRDISHLPVEETVLIRDEVAANPDAYREIERIVTDRFDYQPGRIFIHRTVRLVHVAKDDPDAAPLKPAAPPSLGLGATPRLVAYVTAAKYCHHRPHYRTEGILQRRHRVHFPRNTLCHWDKVVADTIEPLYKLIHHGLLA